MSTSDDLLSILHTTGGTLGAAAAGFLGAAYSRFRKIEKRTAEFREFLAELAEFPHATHEAKAEKPATKLAVLKRYIDARVAPIARPISTSKPDTFEALSDVLQRLATLEQQAKNFESMFRDAAQRMSESEDAIDSLKDEEADSWLRLERELGELGARIKTVLSFLRSKR